MRATKHQSHRNGLGICEHLLGDLVGVVLLAGRNEDTLDGVGRLAELEEDHLGAYPSAIRHPARRKTASKLTLGTRVLETSAADNLLANVGVGDGGKVEPLAA
jgi:hypothetical protein